MIIKAQIKHLSQIIELAKTQSLKNIPEKERKEKGFLISNFNEEVYKEYLNEAKHFYLYTNHNELLGFILAFRSEQIKQSEWLNNKIKQQARKPFILIKQIAIKSGYESKGIASLLYKNLFTNVKFRPFYAAIVIEPYNKRSVKFHEKHGFKKVMEETPPDNIKRGVWFRNEENYPYLISGKTKGI
jgi:predicted GNAT superfamily acetyltransferase